jgi:hypothetical protein
MTCYDVNFVAFNFSTELEGGLFGIHSRAQGFGHILNVILVQIQLGCDLHVRQIQAHQVKAQYPNSQWLVVPLEDSPAQIVEIGATALAVVPLTSWLGLVVSVSNHLTAAAIRAAYTVWPPDIADGVKAFGIIDKSVDFNEQAIA